jgi:hypothetical protein
MSEPWQVITALPTALRTGEHDWRVLVEGLDRADGTWAGRLHFINGTTSRVTGQETSQPNRQALEYWATGLEGVYVEGAFNRAR